MERRTTREGGWSCVLVVCSLDLEVELRLIITLQILGVIRHVSK